MASKIQNHLSMTQSPFVFIFIFSLLAACRTSVNPNEWVVSTGTCWNTFTVSKAGDPIPRSLTACDKVVVLPATAMAADFQAETKFKSRVAGFINVTYQWAITDPVAFIKSAKSVTSSDTDSDHKIDPNVLEEIENSVVDKMLIDVIREYTPSKEAGVDEKQVEDDLGVLTRSQFMDRGVAFYNMSVNINFSPQTEEALDVISALKIYKDNGEEALGREVIRQKAGATKVLVQQKGE